MDIVKVINAVISFGAEMAMLAFLAIGGYNMVSTTQVGRWFLAILLPSIVIILWAFFIAPNSAHRLTQPWLCVAQIILFTIAAAVAYKFTNHALITVFLVCAYGSAVLAAVTKQ